MTTPAQSQSGSGDSDIPAMQRLLDNPFMLLIIGVGSPSILYTIWGVIEVALIPMAK